jgi:hypothetical protein
VLAALLRPKNERPKARDFDAGESDASCEPCPEDLGFTGMNLPKKFLLSVMRESCLRRQHTSAYVSVRQRTSADVEKFLLSVMHESLPDAPLGGVI